MFRKVVCLLLIFVIGYAFASEGTPIFDADDDGYEGADGVIMFDAEDEATDEPTLDTDGEAVEQAHGEAVDQPEYEVVDQPEYNFGGEAGNAANGVDGQHVEAAVGGGATEVVQEVVKEHQQAIPTTTEVNTIAPPTVPFEPSNDCGPQGCRSNGEIVCGEWKYKHQAFSDLCDLKAHNCETGDDYEQVDISLCPLITYSYCRDFEDLVCVTADNENFLVFKNFCLFAKYQATSRKVYWAAPLSTCFHLPEMPIEKCFESAEVTSGEVCGFDGDKTYKLFSDYFELFQEKCYENGDWRKVSMIYC